MPPSSTTIHPDEEAWRRREIEDYPLFPAGRIKGGKAKRVAEPRVLSRDAARKMSRQLEAVAGVASLKGRAGYGVRRIATTLPGRRDRWTARRRPNSRSDGHSCAPLCVPSENAATLSDAALFATPVF